LQFSVDEETERTVIKVIDSESGELIRQIPDEVFLELARKLNDDGGFQLIDALG
jgi:flagellar protein FlaG